MARIIDAEGPLAAVFKQVDYAPSAYMAEDNGTTDFGRIEAGTTMGEVTATGLVRPCGRTEIHTGATSATLSVDDASNFYVGDTVDVLSTTGVLGTVTIDGDGATTADIDVQGKAYDGLNHTIALTSPTLGVIGYKLDITASGAGDGIDVYSLEADGKAHTVTLVDPGGNDKDLQGESTLASDVETLVISLATGGAGAISSTVQDVIDEINASSQKVWAELHSGDNGAATAIAVAIQTLANGVAAPADKDLKVEETFAATTDTAAVNVTLGLNAAGTALASTVNEVIGAINTSTKLEARLASGGTGTNTAAAVSATALAGEVAAGGALVSGSTVSAVDKTSSPNTITIGSSITTVADDEVIVDDGCDTCVGLLWKDANTATGEVDADGDAIHSEVGCHIVKRGVAIESACTGVDADLKADIPNVIFE